MVQAWLRRARLARAGRENVMSRRAVLRAAALGVAAGLAGGPALAAPRGRVVVVGAGFAGLSCALELAGAGFDPIVLEARDRVGGRVWTRSDLAPGRTVEFGGELIGANHPHWLAYAERFGLTMRDVPDAEGESRIVLDGRLLDAAETALVDEGMARVEEALNAAAARVNGAAPWDAADAAALDARSLRAFVRDLRLPRLAARAFDVTLEADNAAPTRAQSLLANLAMIAAHGGPAFWTQTEVYRCAQGNQRLAEDLANALGRERIRLATPVAEIGPRPGGARVRTRAGETIDADVVVLAAPPSVWPRMRIEPAPPIAAMGDAFKHLTWTRRRVWAELGASAEGLSDDLPSMTWDGFAGQPGDEGVLVGFSGGRAASIAGRLPAAARAQRVERTSELLFPGLRDSTLSTAVANWPRDPWTGAGYSFPRPGQLTRERSALRDGFAHLRFAGEHVSTGFVGYMEGALETGVAAARAIAKG